jgi:hypothetical protein
MKLSTTELERVHPNVIRHERERRKRQSERPRLHIHLPIPPLESDEESKPWRGSTKIDFKL